MQLPNGHIAIVPNEKLLDYCLDPEHPAGRHKALVFSSSRGITRENPDALRAALLSAAANSDAALGSADSFGRRYVIDFPMTTPIGTATAWKGC